MDLERSVDHAVVERARAPMGHGELGMWRDHEPHGVVPGLVF